jgi:transcriptional regulator NrdR family protein
MDCPGCKYPEMRVIESRPEPDSTRRRRACMKCGLRVTTEEHFKVAKKKGDNRETSTRIIR